MVTLFQNISIMKTISRLIVGVLILGGALLLTLKMLTFKKDPPISSRPQTSKLVKAFTAEPAEVSPITYMQGRTIALNKIEVYSEVGGRLLPQSNEFRAGVRFNKGQSLMRIDDGELRMTLVAQRSGFMQLLTSTLADIKLDFPSSYETWKAYTSNLELDKPLPELPSTKTDQEKFFFSNKGILNQYYTIRSSEERLQKYTVAAPFGGEVSQALVNPGALVRVGQKMGEFVSFNEFEVESALSAGALNVVMVGDPVAYTTMGTDNTWSGKVVRISESIDPSTQSSKVFCSVKGDGLRDGMYLNGEIASASIANAVRVNLDLLTNGNTLYYIQDTALKTMQVEVLYTSEKDAIVSGVPTGTKLLKERINNAFDGMPVKVSDK
ncbi:MAG: membrane fusion protein (multidrug efflux system) [Flavobacteriales bacterium]|jgi:membrane fusion protein (multidrug efflux system)